MNRHNWYFLYIRLIWSAHTHTHTHTICIYIYIVTVFNPQVWFCVPLWRWEKREQMAKNGSAWIIWKNVKEELHLLPLSLSLHHTGSEDWCNIVVSLKFTIQLVLHPYIAVAELSILLKWRWRLCSASLMALVLPVCPISWSSYSGVCVIAIPKMKEKVKAQMQSDV